MIQLHAIIDGHESIMLTGNTIEEAERSCIDRFGADRFTGFAPIPPETKAKSMWAEYRGKRVSREGLDEWLAEQEDEQKLREALNRLRAQSKQD